jgi:hypothetical protein
MFFRYILVNSFSFIKRFFAFNATLYNTIVFIPIFTVFTNTISKRSLSFVFLFSLVILFSGNTKSFGQLGLYFLLLLAIPMFKKVNFEQLIQKSFLFYIIVSFYGISQKLFGYTPVEINWIRSGLSFAEERAFIASNDIRPFSTFASMPEFTLFISIYLYYFKTKGKILLLLFSFVMLYIAGSRGIFVSVITAYTFVFILKKYKRKHLWISFLASLTIFLFLIFLFPLLFNETEFNSRMLAYGTFNGRIELLTKILDVTSPSSILTGVNLADLNIESTFDNMYFMLVANFGIFGALYFILFFLKQKIDRKSFYFITIFLGYGFYADIIFSYYLMFLFFFAMYSYSSIIVEKNNHNQSISPLKLFSR